MTGYTSNGKANGLQVIGPVQVTRAVVYSRVSTDAQERDGTSLDTQERESLEYATAAGWQVIECIRDASSGYTLERPGIKKLRDMLGEGEVDVVVAYAVDRLSRNQNHIGVLLDEVEQAGAKLEFVTEIFEDTAIGRFILAARAFMAEVEREKISERTMRGKAERARQGRIPQGTGKGIYGYTYNSEIGQREIEESQAPIVREIFDRFCDSQGCSKIAGGLNREGVPAFSGGRWHPLTVRRMLMNETYTGRTTYRRTKTEIIRNRQGGKKRRRVVTQPESEWIDIPGATPPIVSHEKFAQAQAIFQDPDRRLRGQPTRVYRLRGRLRCIACGTPMVGQSLSKGKYFYYRCRRTYAGNFEEKCDSQYIRVEHLERVVVDQIAQMLSDPQRILEEARRLCAQEIDTAKLEAVDRELSGVEEQQSRLADLYVNGSIPENILAAKNEGLKRQRKHFETERRAIEVSRPRALNVDSLAENLPEAAARLREWVETASEDDFELILGALQVQVSASRDQVQIEGSVPVMVPEGEDLVTIVQTSASLRGRSPRSRWA